MCNCLETALNIITRDVPEWEGKKVKSYSFRDKGINYKTGKTNYNIGIDIEFENQKKKDYTFMVMEYCPLCGKKFEED